MIVNDIITGLIAERESLVAEVDGKVKEVEALYEGRLQVLAMAIKTLADIAREPISSSHTSGKRQDLKPVTINAEYSGWPDREFNSINEREYY